MDSKELIKVVCRKMVGEGTERREEDRVMVIIERKDRYRIAEVVDGFEAWSKSEPLKYMEYSLPVFRKNEDWEWEKTDAAEHMNVLIWFEWLFSSKKFAFHKPTGMAMYVFDKKPSDYRALPK